MFTDNDVSATVPIDKRPGGRQLLAAIRDGTVDHVVAWATDRLYRRPDDQLLLLRELRVRGGVVATVRDGEIDTTSEAAQMTMGILANVAEFELNRKRKRIEAKQRELADAGFWHGGPRPFGYRVVPAAKGKTLEPVPDEADAIRDAVGRILDGEALRSVVRRWNEAGLRTPERRRDGNGSQKPGANPWTAKALKGVLTSPRIAGRREYRGEDVGKASWPAIVDRRTWQRVVAEFERRAEGVQLPKMRRYPLTGFLVCGTCSAPLVGHPVHGKRSYTCLSKDGKHAQPGTRPRIAAEPVEDHVLRLASERDVAATVVRDPDTVAPELRAKLDAIEERITAWAREAATAGLEAAEIHAGRAPLVRERDRLERRLAERTTATASRFSHVAAWLDRGAPDPTNDPEYRAWLETILDRIEVRPAGRSKWVPVEKRVRVRWKKGVRRVAKAS